jgi:uncharacterized DUF497 family protein
MEYVWDDTKERANIAKHGVSFTQALQAFDDTGAIITPDHKHSQSELRWWLLGLVDGRVMTVRYTEPRTGLRRIIGAGYWRKQENL